MDKQLYARMDKQLEDAIDQSFVAQSGDADLCFACKENEVCTFQVCKNASCKTADSNDDTGAIWVGERTTEFALCSEWAKSCKLLLLLASLHTMHARHTFYPFLIGASIVS